jgi:homoserine kinase type II
VVAVYTSLDARDVEDLLVALGAGPLERFEAISQGIENTNYQVRAGGESFVLTVFEEGQVERLEATLRLAGTLARRGVPCPAPREGMAGPLAWVRGKPAALVPFVSGEVVWSLSDAHLEALGAAVARLHRAGEDLDFPFSGPHRAAELVPLVERLAAAVVSRDPARAELLRAEARYQAGVPDGGLPGGVIHADLFRDNILFRSGDAQVAGLIDFQMAAQGPWLYDLAVILLDAGWDGSGVVGDRARALLRGYRAVRPVTGEEYRLLPDFLRRAALRFFCLRLERFVVRVRPMAAGGAKDPEEYAEKLRLLRRAGGDNP